MLAHAASGEELFTGKPTRIVRGQEHSDRNSIADDTGTSRGACAMRFFSKSEPMMPPLCVPSVSTMPGLMVFTRDLYRMPGFVKRSLVRWKSSPLRTMIEQPAFVRLSGEGKNSD